MRESQVERYFVEAVTKAGGLTRKVQWIGQRGCPDRFWAFPRVEWSNPDTAMLADGPYREASYGFAEIKAPGCAPRDEQEREIRRLRGKGVEVVVLDSFFAVDQWMLR